MGCGRTNTTTNKIQLQKKGFIEKKQVYDQACMTFKKFIEKNPDFEIKAGKLKSSEIEEYVTSNESLLKTHQITRKVVINGIKRLINKELYNKSVYKGSCFEVFIEVMDKIKQTDTDVKILKEIVTQNCGKSFHIPNNYNQVALVLDLEFINDDDLIISLVEQAKYEYNDKLSHITIKVPISYINKGHLFIEIGDLIENSINLISCSVIIQNIKEKYTKVNLNGLLPTVSAIKGNLSIKNVSFGCYNCLGIMSTDMQNEVTYMLNDNLFSLGLANLDFISEVFDYLIERIMDMTKLKLFLYEPPTELSFETKNLILNRFTEQLHDTDSIEMIYFTGFEDCSEKLITNSINLLRKKGVIKSVIVDKSFDYALKRYYDN